MPNQLQHKGFKFACDDAFGLPEISMPGLHVRRCYHWSKHGETEIVGGIAGRKIVFRDLWIHPTAAQAFDSWVDLDEYLKKIDRRGGLHGSLFVTFAGDVQQYSKVTFDGFERGSVTGQAATYHPDLMNSAISPGGGLNDSAWFIQGNLHFYQLSIDEE